MLAQVQKAEPFTLPLEIGIAVAGTALRVERVELTGRTSRFTFAADRQPSSLVLDPDVKLLMDGRVRGAPASR